MDEQLMITTLGGLSMRLGGRPVVGLASRKAEALLVYLACTRRPHEREHLGTLLWDERSSERARGNLTVLLASLRKELAPFLFADRHTVGFNTAARWWLDVAELEAASAAISAGPAGGASLPAEAAARLEQALDLYRGDFLQGFVLRDSAGFEEWLLAERQALSRLAAAAHHALLATYKARGDDAAALAQANELLRLDRFDEGAHRQVLLLLARSGRRGAALEHYERLRQSLAHELGFAPAEATTALYASIRAGEQPGQAAAHARAAAGRSPTPAARPGAPRVLNVPFQPTSFVGRDAELAQLARRLSDPACRVLTLVGPGGIGKSRLAAQVAAYSAAGRAHGAAFVPLAPLEAGEQIVPAIAAALGLTFGEHTAPRAQLLAYLAERDLLLVLDNFEHLLEEAGLLNALIEGAPRLTLLVTSRERLRLRAEWLFEVEGLPCPPDGPGMPDPGHFGALQLFAQRATQLAPGLLTDPAAMAAAARICRLVEGMPLAIELAAGRVVDAPCAMIADQIASNLDVLASELRDVPARHRSVRAAFAYSWGLLAPAERAALARLACFEGGCAEEAALQVAGAPPDLLAALAEKSMLRRSGERRYELHELLRQFTREHLAPAELRATEECHGRYYLALLGRSGPLLAGRELRRAMAELRPELDNLRRAWSYAVAAGLLDALAQGLDAMGQWYLLTGNLREGVLAFGAAIERVRGAADPRLLARLLVERADLQGRQGLYHEALADLAAAVGDGDEPEGTAGPRPEHPALLARAWAIGGEVLVGLGRYEEARGRLERGLALAREAGQGAVAAACLRALGMTHIYQGEVRQARARYEQALAGFRAAGDQRGEAYTLNNLGVAAEEQGDYAAAQAYYEQALAISRDLGNRHAEANVLSNLGVVASGVGRYADAVTYYEQSLVINREIGDRQSEAITLLNLGDGARSLGDLGRAVACCEQSLELRYAINDRLGKSYTLTSLGLISLALGEPEPAIAHLERALVIAREVGARSLESGALAHLGQALAALGRHAEAVAAFERSIVLREELGERHRAIESRCGLAAARCALGEVAAARQIVAEHILPALAAGPPDGTTEPLLIYWDCYAVLHAAGDPRAAEVLAWGGDLLQAMAAWIDDPATRRAFLAQERPHRRILAAGARGNLVPPHPTASGAAPRPPRS